MSNQVLCVAQGGASHANWRVPGAFAFYARKGFELEQIEFFKHPGVASHSSQLLQRGIISPQELTPF